MFEINITWWKMEGEPDPDETARWTRPIPQCPNFTPVGIVKELVALFANEPYLDATERERDLHSIPGKLEKAGENFPEPFGEEARFVPAMRLRFMADRDQYGEYHGMNNRIQKAFGLQTYGRAADYEHSALWLAKALDAVVEWRDDNILMLFLPDGDSYDGLTETEDAQGNVVKTDTEKNLRKKLEDFMPAYRLKQAVIGE